MSLLAKLKAQREARENGNADAKPATETAPATTPEAKDSPASAPSVESDQGGDTGGGEPVASKPALRLPLGARRPAPSVPAKVTPMEPVSGADFAEAVETVSEAREPQAPKGIIRRPLGGLVRKPIASTPKQEADTAPQAPSASETSETAPPSTPVTPKLTNPTPATGGIIGAMKRRALERTAEPRPSPVAVAAGAQELVGPTYSPEQMLADLQLLEQDAPADLAEEDADEAAIAEYAAQMEELNSQRAKILTKGANTIEEIFQGQMTDLQYASATDQSMATVASIVTLTFLRLKTAPNAWALMELADQAKVIAGMRAMAVKRNSIVSKKKPKEAAAMSEALDAMAALPESESLDVLIGGFDLDGF